MINMNEFEHADIFEIDFAASRVRTHLEDRERVRYRIEWELIATKEEVIAMGVELADSGWVDYSNPDEPIDVISSWCRLYKIYPNMCDWNHPIFMIRQHWYFIDREPGLEMYKVISVFDENKHYKELDYKEVDLPGLELESNEKNKLIKEYDMKPYQDYVVFKLNNGTIDVFNGTGFYHFDEGVEIIAKEVM